MVEEVEAPGSMALSVESCVWSCLGLFSEGDGETRSAGLIAEGEEAILVGETVVVVVQVASVLALLVIEAGGL